MITRRNRFPKNGLEGGVGLYVPAPTLDRFHETGWVDQPGADPRALASPPPAVEPAPLELPDYSGQAAEAETMFKDFGGRSLIDPNAKSYQSAAPWIQPPDGYEPFFPVVPIDTPAANDTDTTILTLTVPNGWDGILRRLFNYYTGPGFINNIGQMVWRLLRNGTPVRNFESIQMFYGQFSANAGVVMADFDGIQMRAGDVFKLVVNHASTSPLPVANTKVLGGVGGYFYPKES